MIRVDITEEDIRDGVPCEPCGCPVVLGLERAFGKRVSVTPNLWRFADDCIYYDLPDSARTFIYLFDNHSKVEPFTFEVETW